MIDMNKVQAASFMPGLQDLGAITPVVYNFTGTLPGPANSVLRTSVIIPFARNDVLSLLKINVAGTNFSSAKWFPLNGTASLYEGKVGYFIIFNMQSDSAGRKINITFVNNLSSASITLPSITFTFSGHLYSYPF
jgi:hypothetical protein